MTDTRNGSIARKLSASVLLVILAGAWLAPAAHAQIAPIDTVVGGIDTVVGGDGATTSAGSDSGSGGTGAPGLGTAVNEAIETVTAPSPGSGVNPIGQVVETVDNTKTKVEETAGDTNGGPVGQAVNGAVNTVKQTIERTGDSLTGAKDKKKDNDRRESSKQGVSNQAHTTPSWTEVMGGVSMADAMRADGIRLAASKADGTDYSVGGTPAPGESVIAQIGRVAAEAAQRAAFPIALTLMVAAFLMVQNRIDRRDPKLALAPVDPEHDLLSFT